MPTAFPTIPISQSSARGTQREINVVRFGNGYEQRVPMGINYKRDVWNISWDALTLAEKNTIVTFIDTVSDGSTITWTSPLDSVQKKFVLDGDWQISNRGGNVWTVSITLRQVYDIG